MTGFFKNPCFNPKKQWFHKKWKTAAFVFCNLYRTLSITIHSLNQVQPSVKLDIIFVIFAEFMFGANI